jgi:hypothetical protein
MGKPLKAWRKGKLDIAAWQNDSGAISFTFRKQYKDKDGAYKESKYLWPSDLDELLALFTEVKTWVSSVGESTEPQPVAKASSPFSDDDIPF